MDAIARKLSRNSRWTRDPVLRDGHPTIVQLTERDIEVFALLTRYRYLPADYIHAFVGGSFHHLTHRLNLLHRRPNLYINRPIQQRNSASANHRHLIYELDDRGAVLLRERGLRCLPNSYHRNFAHELMVAEVMASFELGATNGVRLIPWSEILANPKTPCRDKPQPHKVAVSYSIKDQTFAHEIAADAFPFGLERTIDGSRSYLFFPGIEADCGTEPIESSDFERTSICRKFAAYRSIARDESYRTHFGFPNFFVPFITTTTARMESMMRLLERMTAGHGSKMFLFTTFPAFHSFEQPPPAGDHMMARQWQRVGFEPFKVSG